MAGPMNYLDAVDTCYAALEQGGQLDSLIQRLGEMLGAEAGDVVSENAVTGELRTYGSFGFDPVFRDSYDSEFLGANPWAAALERVRGGRLRTDIEDSDGYRRSAYFNEWVRPQGLERSVGARLSQGAGQQTAWVGFVRASGARAFSGDTVVALERLLPHLSRVITLANRLNPQADASPTGPLAVGSEAAMLIGSDRRIVDLNPAAERLLDGQRLCRTRDDRLMLNDHEEDKQFRRALAEVFAVTDADAASVPGQVCLAHGRGGAVTALSLLPYSLTDPYLGSVRRLALVLLGDWQAPARAPDLRPLSLEFRLTPTECELVAHLAAGGALDGFAEARGMAVSTARWHLKNAEAKTGTNRAEQLVALAYQRGFRSAAR